MADYIIDVIFVCSYVKYILVVYLECLIDAFFCHTLLLEAIVGDVKE